MNRCAVSYFRVFAIASFMVLSVVARRGYCQISGLATLLDPTVVAGTVYNVPGPPAVVPHDGSTNSIAERLAQINSRKGPGSIYQSLAPNWPNTQFPNVPLTQIGETVQQSYNELVMNRVSTPSVLGINVTHRTLVYPSNYYLNPQPVTVRVKRFTLNGADGRTLVGYYVNYDKINQHNKSVIFQVNGHFGNNPSWRGLGMVANGGASGAGLAKIALQGLPMIVYDDHNVGESSSASDSLSRTVQNIQMMDRTLLGHFNRVDAVGLSGGGERLYHHMGLFQSNVQSAYVSGMFDPTWTYVDAKIGVNSPFGYNSDTYDAPFFNNFLFADMSLLGISRGVKMAFASMAGEDGIGKYGLLHEAVPIMNRYTSNYELRGDDLNGDGAPDSGPGLGYSHEYNIPDLTSWLSGVRAAPETYSTMTWTNFSGGDWSTGSNWTGSLAPNANNHIATLGAVITGPKTVFSDQNISLKTLNIDNTNSYAVAGNGTLTFATDTGNAAINVIRGVHQIQLSVALASNIDAYIAPGATLEFNNRLDLGGKTLTKLGEGTLNINNELNTGGGMIIVLGGSVGGGGAISGDVVNASGILRPGDSSGAYGGATGSSAAVPEPSAGIVLVVGAALLAADRRRRHGS